VFVAMIIGIVAIHPPGDYRPHKAAAPQSGMQRNL
jgi:hypothetical protein